MNEIAGQAFDAHRTYGPALPQFRLWHVTLGFKKNAKIVETNYIKSFIINKSAKKTNSKRTQNHAGNCLLERRNRPNRAKRDLSARQPMSSNAGREFDFTSHAKIVGTNYVKFCRINKSIKKRTQNELECGQKLLFGDTPRGAREAMFFEDQGKLRDRTARL